jgi:hypothetical protein
VIAPNQDFVLSDVPRQQAGTAGGALITAQRLGAAIGIAVIGTALFGSSGGGSGSGSGGSGGSGGRPGVVVPTLVHNAQAAALVNLGFVLAALLCTFGLPRALGGSGEQPEPEPEPEPEQAAADTSAVEAPAQR